MVSSIDNVIDHFEKVFKIPKEQGKLNFVVGGFKAYRNFEVYNTSRVVDDIVIRKIN